MNEVVFNYPGAALADEVVWLRVERVRMGIVANAHCMTSGAFRVTERVQFILRLWVHVASMGR
jgi:hypothetical protein